MCYFFNAACFAYITDTIRAIFKIIFEGNVGEPYNIGNDLEEENVSIYQLAELITKISGKETAVKPNTEAEIKKIQNLFNEIQSHTIRVCVTELRHFFLVSQHLYDSPDRLSKQL